MAALLEFECPACGGGLEFEPTLQKVKCPYCDTELSVEAVEALNKSQKNVPIEETVWEGSDQNQWEASENIAEYICKSCGGQLLCDAHTAATSCPYCGSPVVLSGRVAGELRPDLVIPFQITKEQAKEALKQHTTGKILLPKMFRSENRIDQIQGLYVPFWLFDAEADAQVSYRATKVRTWSDVNYHYVHTRYYSLRRAGSVGFAGVPVDGSSKMANDLMESIEPYDLSKAVDFHTAYLAGYLADKYDVSSEIAIGRANERIKTSTEDVFRATTQGYSSVNQESIQLQMKNGKIRYGLLPVWMLGTHYRGKDYIFAINGQTGKMAGDLPMDKAAYWRWFALILVAVSVLAYGLGMLLNLGGM